MYEPLKRDGFAKSSGLLMGAEKADDLFLKSHLQWQGTVATTWHRIKTYIFSDDNLRACSI
jgi:hypothetical protein